ncbi:ABC transporter permease [Candidatus Soleaferrea massiliensis]|uniref:ABC transporter permease n=1 Tax=Candidatus Soleaferrea massiliensis TaxID=1470354 RepID=UPI00058B4C00|nr:ABC transporter permease [Candidatus Soleaferrea massiliensis]
MYLFENAIRNIFRNKGRNIILALITFLIIFAASVSFLISDATKSIIDNAYTQFGNQVTIEPTSAKAPKISDYLKYGESDLLQKTEFSMTAYGRLDGLRALDEETPDGNANMILISASRADLGEDFRKGLRSITQGKAPEKKNECLVSEAFAKLNSLHIGAEIKLLPADAEKSGTATLKVSGIYSDNSVNGTGGQMGVPLYNRNNEIITTVETAAAIDFMVNSTGQLFDAVYFLRSPDLLEAFQNELRGKGLPASCTVTANEEEYQQVVAPVEKLSGISNVFLMVVLILGAAVLILVSVMSMRERKYEVGVLRAMGMKKGKVILSMLTEAVAVTAACLIIGLGAGTAAAQPVADILIQQTTHSEPAASGQEDEENHSVIQIRMTASAAGEISLVALLLAGISSAAGILYITRFEPNKILSERN